MHALALTQGGYRPSDPVLFDKTSQSLSTLMALQTFLASGVTDFLVIKCWEFFLLYMSIPMSAPQKCELQVASATGVFLFHLELLEKTSRQVKEDTIIFSIIFSFLPIPFWL